MRPVLVRVGAAERFDILTLSAGRWRGSLLEERRWGPVISDMVEDRREDALDGRERGAFDPPWLRGRSCRSGIEFAVRGRDGSSSCALAAMSRTAGKYLLYIPLGAGCSKDPKRGSMHKPVQARTDERRTKFGKQRSVGHRFRAIATGTKLTAVVQGQNGGNRRIAAT
jgi:hypothetical protein